MKYFQIIVILLLGIELSAQSRFSDAIVYLQNGKVIEGKVNSNFASSNEIKVYFDGNARQSYTKRKIDSLLVGQDRYITKRGFLSTSLLREIETGTVSLYEIDGKFLGIKRKEGDLFTIPQNKYGYTYNLFCSSSGTIPVSLDQDSFVEKVREYNLFETTGTEDVVLYDSIISSSGILLRRISFFRPEIGFELKITPGISFYNSIGMNFYGGWIRDVQTFVNYDYSSELRIYYNRAKRLKAGKNTHNFTGPYIAPTYKYLIDINRDNKNVVGLIHGWQDTHIINSLYSGYRIGIGANPKNGDFMILGFLTMGWTL